MEKINFIFNFIYNIKDLNNNKKYDFTNPSYEINFKDKIIKDKFIVLFECKLLPDFFEILTKGDGSCFYYSINQINNINHLKRKLKLLKINLKNIFHSNDDNIIKKYYEDIENNIDKKINYVKNSNEFNENIKEKLLNAYFEYKYHHIGFGIDLSDALNELKELKIPSEIFILPLPIAKLNEIKKEFNLDDDDIILSEYKLQKNIKLYKKEDNIEQSNIVYILLRRDHYSRLILKENLKLIEQYCENNNIQLLILQAPD